MSYPYGYGGVKRFSKDHDMKDHSRTDPAFGGFYTPAWDSSGKFEDEAYHNISGQLSGKFHGKIIRPKKKKKKASAKKKEASKKGKKPAKKKPAKKKKKAEPAAKKKKKKAGAPKKKKKAAPKKKKKAESKSKKYARPEYRDPWVQYYVED